jgi:hypothetical protein
MSTKKTPGEAKYMREYEARPEQVKNREARNKARAQAEKAGVVRKGDGKDVDHKDALIDGGSNAKSNQRVVTEKTNRGWRAGSGSYDPNKQKK